MIHPDIILRVVQFLPLLQYVIIVAMNTTMKHHNLVEIVSSQKVSKKFIVKISTIETNIS